MIRLAWPVRVMWTAEFNLIVCLQWQWAGWVPEPKLKNTAPLSRQQIPRRIQLQSHAYMKVSFRVARLYFLFWSGMLGAIMPFLQSGQGTSVTGGMGVGASFLTSSVIFNLQSMSSEEWRTFLLVRQTTIVEL